MQGRPPVFFMRSIVYRAAHKKKKRSQRYASTEIRL